MGDSFDRLFPLLNKHSKSYSFICGGKLQIKDAELDIEARDATSSTSNSFVEDPIKIVEKPSLRFGNDGQGRLLTLPTQSEAEEAFHSLLELCSPASFGLGRQGCH